MNDGIAGFSADTEILTRTQGWVTFDRLTYMDEVATRSPEGAFAWAHPRSIQAQSYDGCLLHFRSQVFDFMVGPDHLLPVLLRGQKKRPDAVVTEFRPAFYFANKSRGHWRRMPTTSVWTGDAPEIVRVRAAVPMPGRHHRARELRVPVMTWMRFLGWFISEGWLASAPQAVNVVGIAQLQAKHKPEIGRTLDGMGVPWRATSGGFEFNHGPLAAWLRATAYDGSGHRAWNKRIPPQVMGYPSDLLAEMFEAMMRGDGHVEKTGLRRYLTTSKTLAGDTIEILQKMGAQGWYSRIEAASLGRRAQYRVTARPGHASQTPQPVPVAYVGDVFTVAVRNDTVYVRRNGRTAWCGGS